MDGISAAASVLALVSLAEWIAVHGFKLVKTFKNAEEEVLKLLYEVTNLCGVLHSLRLILERIDDAESAEMATKVMQVKACLDTLTKIKGVLDSCNMSQDPKGLRSLTRIKKTVRWPLSVGQTEELVKDVERQKATLSLAIQSDGLASMMRVLESQEKAAEDVAELLAAKKAARIEKLMASLEKDRLAALDYYSKLDHQKNHDMAVRLRHPGTGTWFVEGSELSNWISTAHSQLWMYGIPGAGKTILFSTVIEEAKKIEDENNPLLFFYCDYNNPDTQKEHEILGSLIRQLAVQSEEALQEAVDFYETYNQQDSSGRSTDVTSNKVAADIDAEELLDLLCSMSKNFDGVMVMIDAVDECRSNAGVVTELISRLTDSATGTFKCLVSSRDEADVRFFLTEWPSVSVAADSTDIRLYVESEIALRVKRGKLRLRPGSNLKETISQTLVEKAEGMFQWVKCQLDHLCELTNDKDRREALNMLPPTLNSTYERILRRINQRPKATQRLVQRVLYWVVCSRLPLQIDELADILSMKEGDKSLDPEARPTEEDILDACGSLLRKDTKREVLEASHYSVVEFLRGISETPKDAEFLEYRIEDKKVQLELARACLQYLNAENVSNGYVYTIEALDQAEDEYPFYEHASAWWDFYSLEHLDDSSIFDLIMMLFNTSKTNNFLRWSQERCVFESFVAGDKMSDRDLEVIAHGLNHALPLHFAALLALDKVVVRILEDAKDVDVFSNTLGSPLHCAVQGLSAMNCGNWIHRNMLQRVETQIGWRSDNRKATIQHLLKAGADPAMMHPGGFSCLEFIAQNSIRLDCGYKLIEAGSLCTPEAAKGLVLNYPKDAANKFAKALSERNLEENDKMEVASILAGITNNEVMGELWEKAEKHRQPESSPNPQRNTAKLLREAARWNQLLLLKDCIEKGYDISEPDERKDTALHLACANGHENAAKILLENSASPLALNKRGETPLHRALFDRHSSVTKILLDSDKKPDFEHRTDDGCTLLSIGAEYAFSDDFERMLELAGENMHRSECILGPKGETLLHYAAFGYNLKNVSLLIDRGFDVNAVDDMGFTPLYFLAYGFESYKATGSVKGVSKPDEIINHLLENGAVIGAQPSTKRTLAMVAIDSAGFWSQKDPKSYLKLFLELPGAHIDAQDKDGRNAIIYLVISCDRFIDGLAKEQLATEWVLRVLKKLLAYMLELKPSLALKDTFGATLLHHMCGSYSLNEACSYARDWSVYEVVLDAGAAEASGIDKRGNTPLDLVLLQRIHNIKLVKLLLAKVKIEDYAEQRTDKQTILHKLVAGDYKGGIEEVITTLVGNGEYLGLKDSAGKTPLVQAILSGQRCSVLRLLIEKICSDCLLQQSHARDWPLTILLGAPEDFIIDRETVKLFIDRTSNLDQVEASSGKSLLQQASSRIKEPWLGRLLLAKGPDLQKLDYDDIDVLHDSIWAGNETMVLDLLEAGADVESLGPHLKPRELPKEKAENAHDKLTPLLQAAAAHINNFNISIINALLDAGAKPTAQDTFGWGMIHWCSRGGREEGLKLAVSLTKDHNILCKGTDDYFQASNLSALHIVGREGSVVGFEILLATGSFPDMDIYDSKGRTPLHYAADFTEPDICRLLCENGASVNVVETTEENTPLHLAAMRGVMSVVKLLLEHGGDPTLKNKKGFTPDEEAFGAGHQSVARILKERCATWTGIADEDQPQMEFTTSTGFPSVEDLDAVAFRRLIRSGTIILWRYLAMKIDPNMCICEHAEHSESTSTSRCTILHAALEAKKFQLSVILIDAGSNVEMRSCDNLKQSLPLIVAASHGSYEVIEIILRLYTPPLSSDLYSTFALAIEALISEAVSRYLPDKDKCLRELCTYGADVEALDQKQLRFILPKEDSKYGTVLHYAAATSDLKAFQILLEYGADVTALDHDGKTAMEVWGTKYLADACSGIDAWLEFDGDEKAIAKNRILMAEVRDLIYGEDEYALKLYLQHQCLWPVSDTYGHTPLHDFAREGNVDRLKRILNGGAFLHARDHRGKTPIMMAVQKGRYDALKFLHEMGAELNDTDRSDHDLQWISTQDNSLPCLTYLIANLGSTPETWTKLAPGGGSLLHTCIRSEDAGIECVTFLIENGADFELLCPIEGYPIHRGCLFGNTTIVKHLLDLMNPETLKSKLEYVSQQNGTALYAAAYHGFVENLQMVLAAGVDIDNASSKLGTALNIACSNGHIDAVKFLLSKNAKMKVTDTSGKIWNALETSKRSPRVLKFMLAHAKKSEEGRKLIEESGLALMADRPASPAHIIDNYTPPHRHGEPLETVSEASEKESTSDDDDDGDKGGPAHATRRVTRPYGDKPFGGPVRRGTGGDKFGGQRHGGGKEGKGEDGRRPSVVVPDVKIEVSA